MAILSSNYVAPSHESVTPCLSPCEWFFSNAAWGLFERQDRQKAERTFFFLNFFFTKPDSCLHPEPLQPNQ